MPRWRGAMPAEGADDSSLRPPASSGPSAGCSRRAHSARHVRLRFAPFLRLHFEPIAERTTRALAEEYSRHLDTGDGEPDIEIVELAEAAGSGADTVLTPGPRGCRLACRVVRTGAQFRVEIGPAGAERTERRPLTANGAVRHAIEPALFSAMPSFGAAFVHGGAVAIAGRGIAIFGSRGSGKTAAVFDLIGAGGKPGAGRAAFLAGDKFPLGRDGTAFPYVRHLHVSAYTMARFEGMAGRLLAAAARRATGGGSEESGGGNPSAGGHPAAGVFPDRIEAERSAASPGAGIGPASAAPPLSSVRRLLGGIRARLSLWRRGELRCRVEDAVPGAVFGRSVTVEVAVWMERKGGRGAGVSAGDVPPGELVGLAAADARAEFARVGQLAAHPAFAAGPESGVEAVLKEALRSARCCRLYVPDDADPREVGDAIRKLAGV
ncbi:MAG: hypothetical protein N3A38_02590 [Planctomycetota bacterium]|nr:hypothetical protein [Planctomycetota bacterium]